MKNILCYVALVFLLALIVMPPVLRAVKPKEEEIVVTDTVKTLDCMKTENNKSIFISYKNDQMYMFKYTIIKVTDENGQLQEESDDQLKNSLEMVTNVQKDEIGEEFSYSVFFDIDGYGTDNNFPIEYKQDINSENSYLTSQGYSCKIY